MAQHDYSIANQSGAAFRSDLNNALSAIVSQNSGASAPSTTYAYMTWADTTNGVMKMRDGSNANWITLYQLDGEWTSIAFENGTAAAPSIYFKDSGTDTGFFSPGTDSVGITTGGTERLRFASSGALGLSGANYGNSGQLLTSNGSGSAPTWQDVSFSNVADGTAAAPSIAFGADTNTGIYRPGADTFGISTGGSERVRVTSAGRVGIGTTNPGSALQVDNGAITISGTDLNKLYLSNTSSGLWKSFIAFANGAAQKWEIGVDITSSGINDLYFYDNAAGTTRFRIDSDGSFKSVITNGSTLLPHFAARAYVNFNGTGTVAIRASGNVSSITDNGVGLFTINMSTAMPDTNFTVIGMAGSGAATGGSGNTALQDTSAVTARTTSSTQVRSNSSSGSNNDQEFNSVAIFR